MNAYWYPQKALIAVIEDLVAKGKKKTHICKKIGYTTTAQLNNTLKGTAIMSTKAIQGLFSAYGVNPTYFFSGAGSMYINQIEPAAFIEKTDSVEGYTITEAEVESIHQQLSRLQSYGFSIGNILAGDDNDYTKGIAIGSRMYDMAQSIQSIDEDIRAAKARGIIKPLRFKPMPNPLNLTTDEFDRQFYNDKNRLLKE